MQGDEVAQCLLIYGAGNFRVFDQGLDLGSKADECIVLVIVERLDPEVIASENQTLLLFVPDAKSEHATEFADEVQPVLFVGVDDHLGVGIRLEAMTE